MEQKFEETNFRDAICCNKQCEEPVNFCYNYCRNHHEEYNNVYINCANIQNT
jgi:hypothetical protein